MKKFCFLVLFLFLSVLKLWAVECTVEYIDIQKQFKKKEVETTLLGVIEKVFQSDIKFVKSKKERGRCHFKIIVTSFGRVLNTEVHHENTQYIGGSNQKNSIGLEESLIRGFYKDDKLAPKICKLYRDKYNLNCLLFQE